MFSDRLENRNYSTLKATYTWRDDREPELIRLYCASQLDDPAHASTSRVSALRQNDSNKTMCCMGLQELYMLCFKGSMHSWLYASCLQRSLPVQIEPLKIAEVSVLFILSSPELENHCRLTT